MATIDIPIRSVGPSGMVPQVGAARGAYELEQAQEMMGRAIGGIGRQMTDMSERIERQRLTEASYRATMSLMRLEEDAQSELRNWDKTNHLDENKIGKWASDSQQARARMRQRRDSLAANIDPDMRE